MAFNSANADRPNGLSPLRHLSGGVIRASEYNIAFNYATAIYSGDLVQSAGAGSDIAVGAVTTVSVGVFAGCEYVNDQGEVIFRPYWPGVALSVDTPVKAFVFDDPDLVFEIQADASYTLAQMGQSFDTVSGGGSTITGRSADELNVASAGATGQLRSIRVVDSVDNTPLLTNARIEVIIAEHEYASTRPGV